MDPVKYQTGEITLQKIGKTLGGITPTMVNRLFDNGIEKFKHLSKQKHLLVVTHEEDEAIASFIGKIRAAAVDLYIEMLAESKGDIYNFLFALKKKQIVTDGDMKIITDREIEHLHYLYYAESKEVVSKMLLTDIELEDNIYSTFQSTISRLMFPTKKRGRPRKIPEPPVAVLGP